MKRLAIALLLLIGLTYASLTVSYFQRPEPPVEAARYCFTDPPGFGLPCSEVPAERDV